MKLFYTAEELAKEMHTSRQHIDMLRRLGAITGTKQGKTHIYSFKNVAEFIKKYDGASMSNEKEIRKAVSERDSNGRTCNYEC